MVHVDLQGIEDDCTHCHPVAKERLMLVARFTCKLYMYVLFVIDCYVCANKTFNTKYSQSILFTDQCLYVLHMCHIFIRLM